MQSEWQSVARLQHTHCANEVRLLDWYGLRLWVQLPMHILHEFVFRAEPQTRALKIKELEELNCFSLCIPAISQFSNKLPTPAQKCCARQFLNAVLDNFSITSQETGQLPSHRLQTSSRKEKHLEPSTMHYDFQNWVFRVGTQQPPEYHFQFHHIITFQTIAMRPWDKRGLQKIETINHWLPFTAHYHLISDQYLQQLWWIRNLRPSSLATHSP